MNLSLIDRSIPVPCIRPRHDEGLELEQEDFRVSVGGLWSED